MQGAFLLSGCHVELLPNINKKDNVSLLKVEVCGVCATDRKAFVGPPASMHLPRVLGHECCGTLLVDLGSIKKGAKVALWPALSCGACVFCNSSRPHLCESIQLFGLHLDGGFGHNLSVPECHLEKVVVLPLPPTLSCSKAVFAEPLGCVLHGLRKARGLPKKVIVYGAGLMGRLAVRATSWRWPDAKVMLYDIDTRRRDSLSADLGFWATEPDAADLVFIACSSVDAVYSGLDVLEPGGTIVLFSGLADNINQVTVDHNRLHRKEQILAGSYGCTPHDMTEAINLLAQRQIFVDDLTTSTLPLSALGGELARQLTYNDYKTIIIPE